MAETVGDRGQCDAGFFLRGRDRNARKHAPGFIRHRPDNRPRVDLRGCGGCVEQEDEDGSRRYSDKGMELHASEYQQRLPPCQRQRRRQALLGPAVASCDSVVRQRLNSARQFTTTVIGGVFGSLALTATRNRWPFDAET